MGLKGRRAAAPPKSEAHSAMRQIGTLPTAEQARLFSDYLLARGIANEAETECAALQRLDEVAGWLGATPEQARALAERYWVDVVPRMPEGYRSRDCVDGGRLDAAPTDPVWP